MMQGARVLCAVFVLGDSVPEVFIPQLVGLQRAGALPLRGAGDFYPFKEINQTVEDTERGRVIKPKLRMVHES